MSKAFINDTNLTNIANAIRTKLGVANTYLPSEMAGAVLSIPKRKVVDFNVSPITLNSAKANSLQYVKAYGGTEQRNLPLGYQELEYIESIGTQYIDTGIIPELNMKVKFSFSVENITNTQLWGSRTSGTYNTSTDQFYAGLNQGEDRFYYYSGLQKTLLGVASSGRFTYEVINNNITTTPTQPMALFGFNYIGTVIIAAGCKIYEFKVFNSSNILIQNLIPCKNSSGVLGMYDTVSHQFLTNAGTGDFIAGPYITVPTPTSPVNIVCNNGILKVDANGNVYTQGNQETLQLGTDIATCERLLALPGYTDTQEILNGIVKRNVGIKVLNGTESWVKSSNGSVFYVDNLISDADTSADVAIFCTHLKGVKGSVVPATNSNSTRIYVSGLNTCLGCYPTMRDYADAAAWATFLQTQYNNGTPVIIVYPLATPTTETVTAQSMQTVAGDNTLEITQSALSGLEVECEYFLQ